MVLPLRWRLLAGSLTSLASLAGTALAASPSAEQALKLSPVQKEVEYDAPAPEEIKLCTIKGEKLAGNVAWVVRDAAGQTLRRFVDTNGDNVVDQWCYCRDGLEVYRDIDANFNGKADQYRWLNTAGARWGADDNEDGKVDSWKAISAEEATAEVVKALADQDAARFQRLLLTDSELKSLGLGADKEKEVAEKLKTARIDFAAAARKQKGVTNKTNWLHFGATRPGTVPAGNDGSTKDLLVYENVAALVETAGTNAQVQVGTLIKTGDTWRLVDLPQVAADDKAEISGEGLFFKSPKADRPADQAAAADAPTGKSQQLLTELEALDKSAANITSQETQAKYNAKRADILEQIAEESASDADKAQWLRQLADTVSAAAQGGNYPEGVRRLDGLYKKLAGQADMKELAAYVKFRYLSAEFGEAVRDEKADFTKIQTKQQADLEAFVTEYAQCPDAAEAMMQLGQIEEFAGADHEEAAKKWYGRVAKEFSASPLAKKASGAILRLDCVGRTIRLQGKSAAGGPVDLAGPGFRGKLVLIHYWATWCEPCVADMATIKELFAKYGSMGFAPLGVNLDSNPKEVAAFLQKNRLPWPQLLEPGSLEGRLACELGIQTLPTMILVDKDGKVLNRNINIVELENELKKRTSPPPSTARKP